MQNAPWNKGRLTGQKRPLKPKDVWANAGPVAAEAPSTRPRSVHSLASPEQWSPESSTSFNTRSV
jgi:hypothetical protein